MHALEPYLQRARIAYFSMEIALRPQMHTYSGGLGVLAGDTARTCADLELPMVFVSLVSRAGYVRQEIDDAGAQVSKPNPWRPEEWARPVGVMVAVEIERREVWIRPWLYLLSSPLGHCVPILLLDTNLEQNSAQDREIADHLYGGDESYRLKQELVLGIGGALTLQALGCKLDTYHLNEGHAALLTLYLLRRLRVPEAEKKAEEPLLDHAQVRKSCVFTTHTPVEAAFDRFDYPLVARVLGDYFSIKELKEVAGKDHLNMTQLAFNLSGYVNGVSVRHAQTASRIFPQYHVRAITNGVHVGTWTHPSFARVYDASVPRWAHEPEVLARADELADDAIWTAHQEAKRDLLNLIRKQTGVEMLEDLPLIGFARRMTAYKRPDLLFTDAERLAAIARRRPFALVFAGLAHPRDDRGKELVGELNRHIRRLSGAIAMAFLPNYDLQVAATLVAGADIWLNTPLPPFEASGTSGMKAALNGVLNMSVLDGWWAEASIEGVTGWTIGTGQDNASTAGDAEDFYRKLDEIVLPLYKETASPQPTAPVAYRPRYR